MSADTAKIPSTTAVEEAREALRTLVRVIPQQGGAHIRVQVEGETSEAMVTLPREAEIGRASCRERV